MIKHTKKYNMNVPSWETILDNLNWSIQNKKIVKHKCPGFLISHQAKKIKEVKPVLFTPLPMAIDLRYFAI